MEQTNKMEDMQRLAWSEYKRKYNRDCIYFYDTQNNILVAVAEGTGEKLSDDDIAQGYVDYWAVAIYSDEGVSGGGILLKRKLIDEEDPSVFEVVDEVFTRATEIKDWNYMYLYDILIDPRVGSLIEAHLWSKGGN